MALKGLKDLIGEGCYVRATFDSPSFLKMSQLLQVLTFGVSGFLSNGVRNAVTKPRRTDQVLVYR